MEPENRRNLIFEILTFRIDGGKRSGIIETGKKCLFFGEIQEDG
jgi:hypothetical protein